MITFITLGTIIYCLFFPLAANVLSSELDEARLLLDTAERAKRNLEAEVM